ncbi:hypothetical protein BKM25_17690 [Pseudomonas avellanae]|uniref:Uncharacterized protein n=1 Tax=Pseudomonas syringae group genomosp. 3 TaxID=251701 RepID=A0A2K4WMD8_9PSED|nr:hypothetical protein BKM05_19050 [Pseudomonas avellanae]POR74655.1 hypothetical protein BKM25_17690 [Pseudomonas avellanae]SOS37066.1 hypothetical protein CFBP6411_05713 [Pseudomonas syringae group genomosp. 3]SPF21294.1 hypothetical protein PSCFBP3800_05851 [Pseudomonas syringae group genomosp. 3]
MFAKGPVHSQKIIAHGVAFADKSAPTQTSLPLILPAGRGSELVREGAGTFAEDFIAYGIAFADKSGPTQTSSPLILPAGRGSELVREGAGTFAEDLSLTA